MKNILFLFSLIILSISSSPALAASNPAAWTETTTNVHSSVDPPRKQVRKRHKRKHKKRHAHPTNGRDSLVVPVFFWWILMPVVIIGLFAVFFLTPLLFFWWIALGVFTIWAAISGIVFFPIQYFSFPTGLLLVVLALILKSGLEAGIFLLMLSGGIALLLVAMFAFAFMAIMFLIGTRKYQPKAK